MFNFSWGKVDVGAGVEGRGVEEREPLRKECLFTIFSLNLGSNSRRRETTKGVPQQLWPQTGWSGVLGINFSLSFISGVCTLINK